MIARCFAAALLLTVSGLDSAEGQDRATLRPRMDAARSLPSLPAHAEPFEFTLPRPPADRTRVADLAAGLHDPRTRNACLAGLMRLDLPTLRRSASGLPADRLKQLLEDPATGGDAADACGFLFGLADAKAGPGVLSGAILARAKRGDDATGCVMGLLLCGGEPAVAWLEKLCVRPRCPIGFTLSALTAADVAARDRDFNLKADRLARFATALLASDVAAEAAIDRLAGWRAWGQASAVLTAAASSDDPDALRRRSLQLAAARFALDCAADPNAGTHGRMCRGWLAETAATDADLIHRAKRIAGR
ncbi:hypothetical protein [Alienimonas chondri]|uniref:HEAT repeat domain-containing protein n=1 Tax=Alienimonas chondri TaxID=2681879 RepID=A0ABX1VCC3_9PLAN|nr:hypothetical protein [Alienimonas chondri]NNJ25537.1 hypothetical protein [Alienimonas chondri]